MKKNIKKLLSLLCAILVFGAAVPAFAAEETGVEPTWQNTIESVTPVGDGPAVKIELTPEGYKIAECHLPQKYTVVFKDGTSTTVSISDEPDHFAPLIIYENFVDVDTPDGTVTMYARVRFPGAGTAETYFSVGQYVLQGSLGEDGVPVAGSVAYEFPIFEEKCDSEIDESNSIVRILYFFYSVYLKVQKWFAYHFGR